MLRIASAVLLSLSLTGCGRNPTTASPGRTPRSDSSLVAPEVARLNEFWPAFAVTRELKEPFPCLTVHDSAGTLLGFQVESNHAAATDSGYMGKVPVRVYLDAKARVVGYDVLDNFETPAYLRLALCDTLASRLGRYVPLSGDSIDAVTMATKTSKAIIHAVTKVADLIAAGLAEEHK